MFVAPSNFLRQKMIEHGLDPSRVTHIPNFIFAEQYQESYEYSGYIVYIGRLVREKGVAALIKAMHKFPLIKLLILGEGEDRKNLEKIVIEEKIDNVEFKGYLAKDDLKTVIQKAMFTVVPSEWYEIFGLAILESFAMGKPVLGADIGGIPELIAEGKEGLLFTPGDIDNLVEKISYLAGSKDRIKQMGENARKKVVENYAPDVHYEEILKVYKRLAEGVKYG
jgi:glycosyltransferase involved in cell wall biosynthesis